MKLIKFILVFIFLNTSFVRSEIIKEIKITGNSRISNETVIIYGEIKKGVDYKEKDLNIILKNLYASDFFENVSIELNKNVLNINLKEYQNIENLTITGEKRKSYEKQIKKIIKLREKSSYIKSYLPDDIRQIKNFYSQLGYNFAEVDAKIKDLDKNKIRLLLDIKRGPQTRISSINFIGDKKIRDKRLRDIIASDEDKFWKFLSKNTKFNQNLIDLDVRLLRNYYKSIGYYNVNVNSKTANLDKDGSIDLVYSIDAGKRFIINKIITNPDSIYDKNLFLPLNDKYKKVIGSYYSPFTVRKLLEDIDELIEENNLQFVEHNVEERIESDGISIRFNIFEGEKTLVERINVKGNSVTDEKVIRGELLLDEGDPFTKLALNKSISKIKARNIFGKVSSETEQGSKTNLKIIDIEVEEKPTGEITAGAGIGTSGGTIAFGVSENNWLGEGKRVNFGVDVDKESLTGTINYTNPNYDYLGKSINYFLSSTSNDKPDQGYENTVVEAGANTSFEQYKDIFINLGLSSSYDDLRTDDSASASLKKQDGEFSEIVGSYGLKYDKRNRAFMPTSGSIVGFQQELPLYADKPFIGNTITMSTYKEISENVVGAGKIYLSSINGLNDENVRLNKRKSLSSKRLRGFKRNKVGPKDGVDHVGGNYVAALNFETNLPNLLPESSKSDIALFLDLGNVWGVDYDSSIDESNKLRASTGIGLNWLSPLGPMSFVFSQDLKKAETDETESFTFNLGTTF
jgi:outer membrane protein insertion porin family